MHEFVRQRAAGRCEYCLLRQEHCDLTHQRLSFETGQQLIRGISGLRIVQRAGIIRHCPSQELRRKDSLFVLWQSLEGLQKLGCLTTHVLILSRSELRSDAQGGALCHHLLPLDRAGGLVREIVKHACDARNVQ